MIRELHDVEKYIFISTQKMEDSGKTEWIIDAAGLPAGRFKPVVVTEDSLLDIDEKLRKIDFDDDDEFYVNLTGGTKIMSIGAYNFFRYKSSEIYYVPIGKNVYRKIFPEKKKREFQIDYRLGVTEYLKSYGVTILKPENMNSLLKTSAETSALFHHYIAADNSDHDILNRLRAVRGKKKVAINSLDGLAEYLDNISFKNEAPGWLNKYEVAYLTGDWFEEYAYSLIKEKLALKDHDIATDLSIQRKNVRNQFDVMFTYHNALNVVECKTGIFDPHSNKNILNDTVYKLAALKRDFGLFVKSYIFTLSDCGDAKDCIRPMEIDRGKLFNIEIVDRTALQSDLQSVIDKIKR
jgi:hypothetical protein